MRVLRYLVLLAGLAAAIVALLREMRGSEPRSAQPSHSTVNVVAAVIPVPQPTPAPAAVPSAPEPAPMPREVGFNGLFEGMSGLTYQFEQTGPRVDLYVLHPDGRRRYTGTAYDEGDVLRFESFYSPTYEKWGNFPSMYRRGDALVATNDAGVETVYFRRSS